MPSTIIDSAIFGDIFSTQAMRQVWSDENRTAKYLQIESALAKVQGRLGLIPADAATEIQRVCHIDKIDMVKLKAQTERIGYPILGVVSQINSLCRDKLGEYCHWGATTQDITDTATVLQIREALDIVDADLQTLGNGLAELARKHRDTPMIGRSNLQQAVPVTFGYKMAGLLAAVAAAPRAPGATEAARAAGRIRRCRGHAGFAGQGRDGNPGRPVRRTRPGAAGDRLAHGARHHRRGRHLPRPGRRHARQAQHGREADDADRGGRGVRALRPRPRLEQHHAAKAQPDLQLLHPCADLGAAPARRGDAGCDGGRPRAQHRPVGDRMDRAARGLLPGGGRAGAVELRRAAAWKSMSSACAPTST